VRWDTNRGRICLTTAGNVGEASRAHPVLKSASAAATCDWIECQAGCCCIRANEQCPSKAAPVLRRKFLTCHSGIWAIVEKRLLPEISLGSPGQMILTRSTKSGVASVLRKLRQPAARVAGTSSSPKSGSAPGLTAPTACGWSAGPGDVTRLFLDRSTSMLSACPEQSAKRSSGSLVCRRPARHTRVHPQCWLR